MCRGVLERPSASYINDVRFFLSERQRDLLVMYTIARCLRLLQRRYVGQHIAWGDEIDTQITQETLLNRGNPLFHLFIDFS